MAEMGQVESTGLQKAEAGGVGSAKEHPAGTAMAMVSSVRERVMALPANKRTWLLAAVAFVGAMIAVMTWFAGRTEWKTLFTGLDSKDVAQVSQELASAGITYQVTADGGGVQVPVEMLDKARMEVATKGIQWSCPVLGVRGFSLREMALVVPRVFIEELGILPLRVAGSRILYVGFEDRLDASGALALEQMSELKVESGLVRTEEYAAARKNLLECEAVPLESEASVGTDSLAARITAILEQKQPVASKVVRLHQYYWLRLWLEHGTKGVVGTLPHSGEDMLDYVFRIGGVT